MWLELCFISLNKCRYGYWDLVNCFFVFLIHLQTVAKRAVIFSVHFSFYFNLTRDFFIWSVDHAVENIICSITLFSLRGIGSILLYYNRTKIFTPGEPPFGSLFMCNILISRPLQPISCLSNPAYCMSHIVWWMDSLWLSKKSGLDRIVKLTKMIQRHNLKHSLTKYPPRLN